MNSYKSTDYDDYTSSIFVYGYIGGRKEYVREITAKEDIRGKGYSKANLVVSVDFTTYARQI